MSGLPEKLADAWWGAERAVPIAHALDALLTRLDRQLQLEAPGPADSDGDLLPLSTGFVPLDRVLGGGLWRGTLTIVEADIEAQGTALLNTVARHVPNTCLVDGRRFFEVVTALLAGSAGVPQVSVADACMSEHEWDALISGLRDLRDRDVLVCSTGSVFALANVAWSSRADVLVVHDPGRFGPPTEFAPKLAELASKGRVAVLTSTSPMGDLPEWGTEGVTRLGMHGFDFGGRASLVRPDAEELLAVAQVDVECLSGIVR